MTVFICAGAVCAECGRQCQARIVVSKVTGRNWAIAQHGDNPGRPCGSDGRFFYLPQADEIDGPLLEQLKEEYAKN